MPGLAVPGEGRFEKLCYVVSWLVLPIVAALGVLQMGLLMAEAIILLAAGNFDSGIITCLRKRRYVLLLISVLFVLPWAAGGARFYIRFVGFVVLLIFFFECTRYIKEQIILRIIFGLLGWICMVAGMLNESTWMELLGFLILFISSLSVIYRFICVEGYSRESTISTHATYLQPIVQSVLFLAYGAILYFTGESPGLLRLHDWLAKIPSGLTRAVSPLFTISYPAEVTLMLAAVVLAAILFFIAERVCHSLFHRRIRDLLTEVLGSDNSKRARSISIKEGKK